jgi:hypothetical protein
MVETGYRFTEYFEKEVLRTSSYLKKEWCVSVIERPLKELSPRKLPADIKIVA